MATSDRPIHAAPDRDVPRGEQEHRASVTCWCGPQAPLRDLATGVPVYIHHDRPRRDARAIAAIQAMADAYEARDARRTAEEGARG